MAKRLPKDFDADLALYELVDVIEHGIWSRAEHLFEQLKEWGKAFAFDPPSYRQGAYKADDIRRS